MRSVTFALTLYLSLLAIPLQDAEAQRNCSKGKPCGNTCIARTSTCRVGTPPSSAPARPAPAAPATASPPPQAQQAPAALPPGYVPLDSIEAREVAEARARAIARQQGRATATRPATAATARNWVASSRGSVYYRAGCSGANRLAVQNRIYFATEDEAQRAGYRRSTTRGC